MAGESRQRPGFYNSQARDQGGEVEGQPTLRADRFEEDSLGSATAAFLQTVAEHLIEVTGGGSAHSFILRHLSCTSGSCSWQGLLEAACFHAHKQDLLALEQRLRYKQYLPSPPARPLPTGFLVYQARAIPLVVWHTSLWKMSHIQTVATRKTIYPS